MKRFDCLALDCPLYGPHLLEASAGTGKTFSIEHIYVRLILEGMDVQQILAVTFTRAATRELKSRIRVNLKKALDSLSVNQTPWAYLKPHLDSKEAIRSLTDALSGFDQCQIFTIHGFCYRMLKEFAFEAKIGSLSNPDEGMGKVPEVLRQAAYDFLENGIDHNLLCPEQLSLLFKQFSSLENIVDELVKLKDVGSTLSFSDVLEKCKAALHSWSGSRIEEEKLLEDFSALKPNYKVKVKGHFEVQVRALANFSLFPNLLKEKGSIFDFLDPENKKLKAKEPLHLNYPGFFDWAACQIAPLLKEKVFPVLQKAFYPIGQKILDEEDHFDPDEILIRMKTAIQYPHFQRKVKEKYEAAIIDEFQDTDALQWEIFQTLFFDLKCLYLVGDPKQSIYRFRKADVYTYLEARQKVGEDNQYLLDTNFRSSKSLVGALNALFSRNWLHLPKLDTTLEYIPVQAGASVETDFSDDKGSLHFLIGEGSASFDDLFLPYAVAEIEKLGPKNCAILVRNRFEAEKAVNSLKMRGIAAVAKSHTPLGKTEGFRAVQELLHAVQFPHDKNAANIVMAGPFSKPTLFFPEYKTLLEEKGLVPFAREFSLGEEEMQIFELLFAWERQEGFSFEGLNRYLKFLKNLDSVEGGRQRVEVDEEAVQIMTLHISKGLEFDVVFALGLASRTPKSEEIEEINAEKQRQLYVAMTRAKKRLYVPIAQQKKEADLGAESPIELFSKHFEGSFIEQLEELSKKHSITIETLSEKVQLPPLKELNNKQKIKISPSPLSVTPSFLSSFTTLSSPKQMDVKWIESDFGELSLQSMPRGPETGIIVHKIFERLFSSQKRSSKDLNALVDETISSTRLKPWAEVIQKMVYDTLQCPFIAQGEWFTLREIDRCQVEMEFVFAREPHFIKGFIDLVFYHKRKVYFLDWKTNWLEDYTSTSIEKAMKGHDYTLQASLYSEAIQKHFQAEFGGAFYVFLRGGTYYRA